MFQKINLYRWLSVMLLVVFPTNCLADGEDPRKAMNGEWTVVELSFPGGKRQPISGKLVIGDEERFKLLTSMGEVIPFRFQKRKPTEQSSIYRLSVKNTSDDVSAGGGGVRRAICKLNGENELEILESEHAGVGYYKAIDETTKSQGIYWKLKRVAQ